MTTADFENITIRVICQRIFYNSIGYNWSKLGRFACWAFVLFIMAAPAGCLHLPERQSWPHPRLEDRPASARAGPNPYLLGVAALAGLMALGLALRAFGAGRRAAKGSPIDREDLALLRTARDAVHLLVQKQKRRLRLVRGRIFPGRKTHPKSNS